MTKLSLLFSLRRDRLDEALSDYFVANNHLFHTLLVHLPSSLIFLLVRR